MLNLSDEYAHNPTDVANWQENYVWHAWNPQTRCGWNLHLGRIAEEGLVDVRAHVIIAGEVTAGSRQEPGDDSFAATGLDVDIDTAFERVRVRYQDVGSRGPDAGGWYGREAGDTPFGFDMQMQTLHPVFDASEYPIVREHLLDAEGNHYEVGAAWTGRLWSGATEIEASGLLVRDHSWGGRTWSWDALFWVPMVFDDSRVFGFNWTQRFEGSWTSGSVFLDESGRIDAVDDFWVRSVATQYPDASTGPKSCAPDPTSSSTTRSQVTSTCPSAVRTAASACPTCTRPYAGSERTGFATIQIFPTEAQVERGFREPLPRYSSR